MKQEPQTPAIELNPAGDNPPAPTPKRRKRLALSAIGATAAAVAVMVAVVAMPQAAPTGVLSNATETIQATLVEQATEAVPDAGSVQVTPEGLRIATDENGVKYEANVALVKLEDGADVSAVSERIAATGIAADASISADEAELGVASIELADSVDEFEATEALAGIEGVGVSQPNYVYEIESSPINSMMPASVAGKVDSSEPGGTPDDKDLLGIKAARSFVNTLGIRDKSVTVAVIDTYMYTGHYDLARNIVGVYDAVRDKSSMPNPTGSTCDVWNVRGTAVAGIIAGVTGNHWGPDGVGADKVGIYGIGIGSSQYFTTLLLERSYEKILKVYPWYNIRVVNISAGINLPGMRGGSAWHYPDDLVDGLIARAAKAGIITVCAGGNSGVACRTMYPADYLAEVNRGVGVMGLGRSLTLGSSYSNYNTSDWHYKEISAPFYFEQLLSWKGPSKSATTLGQGTSYSTPVVSATAALMFAVNPNLTVGECRQQLKSSATKLCGAGYSWGNRTGYGRVNVGKAVRSVARFTVSLPSENYKWTGKAIKPTPTVKMGNKTLKNGTDYTVSYSNNVKCGQAKMVITGKGTFAGYKSTRYFYIYYNAPVRAC